MWSVRYFGQILTKNWKLSTDLVKLADNKLHKKSTVHELLHANIQTDMAEPNGAILQRFFANTRANTLPTNSLGEPAHGDLTDGRQ
jgi:hypothetical protein